MPKSGFSKEVSSSADGGKPPVERGEAVCFTAGLHGAPFGAGVLHAYLSTGRPAPKVVAGISLGAVTSAAFQRAYRELHAAPAEDKENARWDWYRRYLKAISEKPFEVMWQGIPNQSDFFAEFSPVKDPYPATIKDDKLKSELASAERDARRDLTLFVYLGRWLSKIPVSIGSVADAIMKYVRLKEQYGRNKYVRFWSYHMARTKILLGLIFHTARYPEFVNEKEFGKGPQHSFISYVATMVRFLPVFFLICSLLHGMQARGWLPWAGVGIPYLAVCLGLWWLKRYSRPLLGWLVYGICLACSSIAIICGAWIATRVLKLVPNSLLRYVPKWIDSAAHIFGQSLSRFAAGVLVFLIGVLLFVLVVLFIRLRRVLKKEAGFGSFSESEQWAILSNFKRRHRRGIKAFITASMEKLKQSLAHEAFANLNLHKSVINDYYLRLGIFELFKEQGSIPEVGSDPFPVVLVAAPLQVLRRQQKTLGACQVWARREASLLDALRASLAVPGLYEPLTVESTAMWDIGAAENRRLDLVDGYVIRQNPIPALFNFLAEKENHAIREQLCAQNDEARIHVVYSVPIRPVAPAQRECEAGIVDVGLAALKLSRRRDTELEVHQTNLLSKIERQVRAVGDCSPRIRPIFADEIAPDTDTDYKNPLDPGREELLKRVASGCRASLEVLHAKELAQLRGSSPDNFVFCDELMKSVSSRREFQINNPGLPEVCASCTKRLRAGMGDCSPTSEASETSGWSSIPDRSADENMAEFLPQLTGNMPRVIFVASGGVFRGSFHAGMLGALVATHIKPDLIVGASVGTLMGGTLAAAFCAKKYDGAVRHIGLLATVLLNVDKEIAFTKPFKNAVRNLGIRGRDIPLSPRQTRRMILDGSRADAGFAVAGAPSALMDAISQLLLIPHKETAEIAAEFVAGHVTLATKKLLDQLRRETLKHLDIELAIIGTSLITVAAQKLLSCHGINLHELQPYRRRGIAVYGTTIDYWLQRPVLLGVEVNGRGPLYDFLEATLCSSAFPCVFTARRESGLYPGSGSANTLYCDGGMFDNLPFLPAIEIMSKVQWDYLRDLKQKSGHNPVDISLNALEDSVRRPDLFIAGSLDVNVQAQDSTRERFDNIIDITNQAAFLQNNVKIKSFEQVSYNTDEQLQQLVTSARKNHNAKELNMEFIDGMVNPAVLPVYPVDTEHLNGTFAFCASTGLRKERVKDSISNGCFQTLRAFVDPASSSSVFENGKPGAMDLPHPLARSISGLRNCETSKGTVKLPEIVWQPSEQVASGNCKYFQCSASTDDWPDVRKGNPLASFACPFFKAAALLGKSALKAEKLGTKQQGRLAKKQEAQRAAENALKQVKAGQARFMTQEETRKALFDAEDQVRESRDAATRAGRLAVNLVERRDTLRTEAREVVSIYERCMTDQRHMQIHDDARKAQPSLQARGKGAGR